MVKPVQDTHSDPVVQEDAWIVMGMAIPVQILQSGRILVDGSPVELVNETRTKLAEVSRVED